MSPQSVKDFVYPDEYTAPSSVLNQAMTLSATCESLGIPPLSIGYAEQYAGRLKGRAAAPFIEGLGVMLRPGLLGSPRNERRFAIELLGGLSDKRRLNNRFGDTIDDDSLFQPDPLMEKALKSISENQPDGDVLVFPMQFGLFYRNMPDEDAVKHFAGKPGEFPLGLLAGACLLASHPFRIGSFGHLGVSFPGDRYDHDKDQAFMGVPVVKGSRMEISVTSTRRDILWANDHGAASGFNPYG